MISFLVALIGCGGGICWPCQKHSRLGHSAGLVPDTPCFFPCRARFTVHPSPLPPPSVVEGTNPSLSRNKRKQPPCGDCFFRLGWGPKKDTRHLYVVSNQPDSKRLFLDRNNWISSVAQRIFEFLRHRKNKIWTPLYWTNPVCKRDFYPVPKKMHCHFGNKQIVLVY